MYTRGLEISQGAKILWEGTIRDVSFKLIYELGVDDSWGDAEERGKAITVQMVQDWIDEMSAQGRIQAISPLTFLLSFENGVVPETDFIVKSATGHEQWISDLPTLQYEDKVILGSEAPPKKVIHPKDCLIHKAVTLTFDATASQERAVRILRAYEEPYTFVFQANGNWSCITKDRVYTIFVDTQKHLGYCTCQDFQTRGLRTGMPCKHIYGYLLQDGRIKAATKEKI